MNVRCYRSKSVKQNILEKVELAEGLWTGFNISRLTFVFLPHKHQRFHIFIMISLVTNISM